MEKALFDKKESESVERAEQGGRAGYLGGTRTGRAECGAVKDKRYIPEDGHRVAIRSL